MHKYIFLLSFLWITVSCNTSNPVISDEIMMPETGQIGIYYFRTSLRCESCDAVEQFVKNELNDKYAEDVKSGKIVYREYNLDEEEVADFALDFNVVFKSLIILKDDQQINLTNDAFLYTLSNPEKFKPIFEGTLDNL